MSFNSGKLVQLCKCLAAIPDVLSWSEGFSGILRDSQGFSRMEMLWDAGPRPRDLQGFLGILCQPPRGLLMTDSLLGTPSGFFSVGRAPLRRNKAERDVGIKSPPIAKLDEK